jgi:hypothetical protein
VRGPARAALGLLALVALAAAALAWWLPQAVRSEAFQGRLREAVRDATGREPRWASLEVSLLPPGVGVEDAQLGAAPAPLAVERAVLQLALGSLLRGRVVVDRVAIEGAVLRLVRTAERVSLAGVGTAPEEAPPAASSEAAPPAPGERRAPEASGAEPPLERRDERGVGDGFAFAVRRLELERSRILLEDRTVEPPLTLELVEVEGRMQSNDDRPEDSEDWWDTSKGLEASGRLASGGAVGTQGRWGPGGELDLTVTLDGVDSAPFAPYVGRTVRLGGAASGTVRVRKGTREEDSEILWDTSIELAEFQVADARIRGPVSVQAELRGPPAQAQGRFAVDASRAELELFGGAARKAPGAPASAEGRIAIAPDGRLSAEDVRVRVQKLGGEADGASAIELRGAFVHDGTTLRSEGLVAELGGQRVELALEVTDLAAVPRHRLRLATTGADSGALLAALGGERGALEGPVTLDAELAGPIASRDATIAGLAGEAAIRAGPGRITGVAPLRRVLDGLEPLTGERDVPLLEPYTGERFESLSGRFAITGGIARTDDLELRYPGYALRLVGTVRLADSGLDARGRLELSEELAAALADRPPEAGAPPRVLPLARIGGTVARPDIRVEERAALALLASAATAGQRDELERKIDGVLGPGAGRGLFEVLDGLLAPPEKRR